jgi:hypothetical protein
LKATDRRFLILRSIRLFVSILEAAHIVPGLVVTGISFALSAQVSSIGHSALFALTILMGQFVVGWSNDLIDMTSDRNSNRFEKPLVSGAVKKRTLHFFFVGDLVLLFCFTFFGPIGILAGLLHCSAVLAAFIYNYKLKNSILSFLPYAYAFGLLPATVYLSSHQHIQYWMVIIGASFGIGSHFANVLKDWETDARNGEGGAPQKVGVFYSKVISAISFCAGSLVLTIHSKNLFTLIICPLTLGFFAPMPRKYLFPLAMSIAILQMLLMLLTA